MDGQTTRDLGAVRDAVAAHVRVVEGASELGLLRAVDATVDRLCQRARMLDALDTSGRLATDAIRHAKVKRGHYVDPEGALGDALTQLIAAFTAARDAWAAKERAIDRDARLKAHHCDQLHSAYHDWLAAIDGWVDLAGELRAAIVTHDLAAAPRRGTAHATVRELHADLMHG